MYPTRYSQNRKRLPDHIALNSKYDEVNLNLIESYLSDHASHILNLSTNNNQAKKTLNKNVNKVNYNLIIHKVNLLVDKNNDNININQLYNSVIEVYNSCTYQKK